MSELIHDSDALAIEGISVWVQDAVAKGEGLIWNMRGIRRVIPYAILVNALQAYTDYLKIGGRRIDIPRHVGLISWSQTQSLAQEDGEFLKPKSSNTTPDSNAADQ